MTASSGFSSFKEFYPYYLTEHADARCRALHFVGTSLVISMLIAGIFTAKWYYFVLMPVLGYGFAWLGHFGFEKNRPAALRNPFYSLASDFLMFWHILTGQLGRRLDEAQRLHPRN